LLFKIGFEQQSLTQIILRLLNAFRFIFQGGLMLIISIFADLYYFYTNLFLITRDYSENPLTKYKYFTFEDLKVFEEIVDEIILELKNRVKKATNEKKDKDIYKN
jgi:hypothetical protein